MGVSDEEWKKICEEALVKFKKENPNHSRDEIEAAWPTIVMTFAHLNESGPGPGSDWSRSKFDKRLREVLEGYEALYHETVKGRAPSKAKSKKV